MASSDGKRATPINARLLRASLGLLEDLRLPPAALPPAAPPRSAQCLFLSADPSAGGDVIDVSRLENSKRVEWVVRAASTLPGVHAELVLSWEDDNRCASPHP
jgi:hypothetical protein